MFYCPRDHVTARCTYSPECLAAVACSAQEAALKYFILGAFSSAFFIFGAAMLYGFLRYHFAARYR